MLHITFIYIKKNVAKFTFYLLKFINYIIINNVTCTLHFPKKNFFYILKIFIENTILS